MEIKDEALKEIKNVDQLAAALPKLIKETPPPVVVEEKSDVRKEPPIPEAPVVKVVSENPPAVKDLESKANPIEDAKKKEPTVLNSIPSVEKKEEIVINSDAIKKEDDEIKEVQKQDILKKKEELIEKLEENEQKQQKLIEEQKKILQDIKLEKEKLVEEDKMIDKLGKVNQPEKNVNKDKLENQVIVEGKEIQPVDKKEHLKNVPADQDSNIIKQIQMISDTNSNQKNVMTDDVVKKNMADGMPLPLAVQHMAVDGVKSAKIVENLENLNEGNADGKVLRREILADSEIKEQREKRDLDEVIESDLKVEDVVKKEDIVQGVKVEQLESLDNKEMRSESESKNAPINDVPSQIESKKSSSKKDLELNEKKEPVNRIERGEEDNEILQKTNKNTNDQCEDKTKSVNMKFTDELKPQEASNKDSAETKLRSKEILTEDKTAKNILIKEEKSTESIIKTPAFLSDPGLILPDGKVQGENSLLNNEAKPMKRELKSFQLQQDNKKDTES